MSYGTLFDAIKRAAAIWNVDIRRAGVDLALFQSVDDLDQEGSRLLTALKSVWHTIKQSNINGPNGSNGPDGTNSTDETKSSASVDADQTTDHPLSDHPLSDHPLGENPLRDHPLSDHPLKRSVTPVSAKPISAKPIGVGAKPIDHYHYHKTYIHSTAHTRARKPQNPHLSPRHLATAFPFPSFSVPLTPFYPSYPPCHLSGGVGEANIVPCMVSWPGWLRAQPDLPTASRDTGR